MKREIFCHVQFKRMLFAAVMTMVVMSLTYATDTILAGRLFGDNAMAGVNLVKPILYLSAFFALMISTGTSYLYSFEIGVFHKETANKLVGQGVILTIILAVVLRIIAFFGEEVFFVLPEFRRD